MDDPSRAPHIFTYSRVYSRSNSQKTAHGKASVLERHFYKRGRNGIVAGTTAQSRCAFWLFLLGRKMCPTFRIRRAASLDNRSGEAILGAHIKDWAGSR